MNFDPRRRWYSPSTSTLTDIGTMGDSGPIEIAGEVVTATEEGSGTFRSPIGETDCVLAAWEIYEYRQEGGPPGLWTYVATGYTSTPFYLDDGTGRVLIVPGSDGYRASSFSRLRRLCWPPGSIGTGDVIIDAGNRQVYRQSADEELPPGLQALEGTTAVPERGKTGIGNPFRWLWDALPGKSNGDRKYAERVIQPDDKVSVRGTATSEGDTVRPATTTIRPTDQTRFVLSSH